MTHSCPTRRSSDLAAEHQVENVGLSQFRRVDQPPLVKQPDTADMVNHVAEPAGRDQILRTIVRMIVIQVMDFLPFRRPETAELAGMVVALQHNLTDCPEGLVMRGGMIIRNSP